MAVLVSRNKIVNLDFTNDITDLPAHNSCRSAATKCSDHDAPPSQTSEKLSSLTETNENPLPSSGDMPLFEGELNPSCSGVGEIVLRLRIFCWCDGWH